MKLIFSFSTLLLLIACVSYSSWAQLDDREGIEFFEKHVRPVLIDNCYVCHGEAQQIAGLRLDVFSAMLRGGETGHAVVPGEPENSLLVQAITYEHDVFKMPPTGKLPDEDIENLTAWVKMGAPHPNKGKDEDIAPVENEFNLEERKKHWSFQPLQDVTIPSVSKNDWVESPIDVFVLDQLHKNGMEPADETDKRSLIRRITYNLTGLPPKPDEVDAFLNDDSDDAYETLVERLLASPHYGERWGRHWLDLVRFAETDGHEFDHNKPNIWRYRDYVIRALNEDVPYDQFLVEHMAGDQLENPRVDPGTGLAESPIGTGYMWLSDVVNSPVDSFKAHADRLDNQVDVFSKAFMGLTVACARCHDHKFDPITQKDFYAMAGIFQSSRPRQKDLTPPSTQKKYERISANAKRIDRSIAEAVMKPLVNQTSEYLLAVNDVVNTFEQNENKPKDVIFADFEDGQYSVWDVEGDAFRDAPPVSVGVFRDYKLDNWRGSYLADSYHNSSNEYTGKLISSRFEIEHNYISFLVAGGDHPGKTCVNLVVDGKTVLSDTGHNSGSLREVKWNVREFWGQEATIEVVDDHTGEWGHIIADHFVFTNGNEPAFNEVIAYAEHSNLNPKTLQHWMDTVSRANNPVAPLFAMNSYIQSKKEESFARWKRNTLRRIQDRFINTERDPDYEVYEDFLGGMKNQWIATGAAFQNAFTNQPQSIFHKYLSRFMGDDVFHYNERGGRGFVHSGLVSDRYEGVMISPIVIRDKRYVHVRMMGTGNVNVVSDEFRARNARARSENEFTWSTHDIRMYQKKRNYVEIVDHDPEGFIVVDQIVFSDNSKPPQGSLKTEEPVPLKAIIELLTNDDIDSFEKLAGAFEERLHQEIQHWVFDEDAGESPSGGTLVDWMLRDGSPFSSWELVRDEISQEQDKRLDSIVAYREDLSEQIKDFGFALTMVDDEISDMPMHIRGNHKNHGDLVQRGFLTAFSDRSEFDPKQRSGRLELAEELIDKGQHLLSRVMVNRIWLHHFGEGIVRSPDDFGLQGQKPTHPELLDWLAAEFIRSGWSIKHMHRVMLLSSTYRMSSDVNPGYETKDPLNKYWHHIPVQRLEAESIRDAVLAVSGQLKSEMFGPSIMPFISEFMDGRGRPGKSGPLDGDGRRSVYINIRRNFMVPMFMAFDYPPPISAIGKRGVSSVPAQALTMLNNDLIYDQALKWAKRMIDESDSANERIINAYELAYARQPDDFEIEAILEFIQTQKELYDEDKELHAWRDLCHVIFNSTEFIFVK